MWNKGWDKVFKQNEWGKYPDMSVVRFVANNFYKKKERKKVSILEIGCGTGANLGFIAKEGFNCFGIDGSRVAINIAKNKLKREKLKSELKIGDIKKLPYKKNTFDCVIDNKLYNKLCKTWNDKYKKNNEKFSNYFLKYRYIN